MIRTTTPPPPTLPQRRKCGQSVLPKDTAVKTGMPRDSNRQPSRHWSCSRPQESQNFDAQASICMYIFCFSFNGRIPRTRPGSLAADHQGAALRFNETCKGASADWNAAAFVDVYTHRAAAPSHLPPPTVLHNFSLFFFFPSRVLNLRTSLLNTTAAF